MNDPYQVLGVSPSASDDEVKAAYRALAKKYHPDRNNGSPEAEKKMMQINDAYAQPQYDEVRRQLQYGQYQTAMQLLEQMNTQTAEWYYLVARARQGLGDDIAALNFARQAVNMEPNNFEYLSFLQQMTAGSQQYRQQGMSFGGIQNFLCQNPCLTCLLFNLCCGGGCGTRIWCC